MGFGALKVKAKAKSGRGSVDAAAIVEAVCDCWDDLQEAIKGMSDEEQAELKKHFNDFGDDLDADGLGDVLFGDDSSDFDTKVQFLSDDVQTKFTSELVRMEVIDEAALQPGDDDN